MCTLDRHRTHPVATQTKKTETIELEASGGLQQQSKIRGQEAHCTGTGMNLRLKPETTAHWCSKVRAGKTPTQADCSSSKMATLPYSFSFIPGKLQAYW